MKNAKFEAYIESLKSKRVAVIGLGISNRPLVRTLAKAGVSVTAYDKREEEKLDCAEEMKALGVTFVCGENYLEHLEADVIFRTPSQRPDAPGLAEAVANGAELTSEMEAFFSVCPCRIIGVTGSDGKTTTTTLIYKLVEREGYRCHVGGNIGAPLFDRAGEINDDDIVVVELSSFQLMTMKQSPTISVVTNLAPNHLDIHKNMDEYIEAKRNIFAHRAKGAKAVFNLDYEVTKKFASDAGEGAVLFGRLNRPERGYWFDGEAIVKVDGEKKEVVIEKKDILLPGLHNVENYMAALAATEGLVGKETIVDIARSFGGVEHREELVRVKDGVRYYNDSIASSPSRAIAALRTFEKDIVLIAGGSDKHIPFDNFAEELPGRVKTLVLVGATADRIAEAVGKVENAPPIVKCTTFAEAVKTASKKAVAGDMVLLSPACASFDLFKNFEDRGNTFKKLVMEL